MPFPLLSLCLGNTQPLKLCISSSTFGSFQILRKAWIGCSSHNCQGNLFNLAFIKLYCNYLFSLDNLLLIFCQYLQSHCINFMGLSLKRYQKLGGLKQRKFVSHFWRLQVQNQGISSARLLAKALGESLLLLLASSVCQ